MRAILFATLALVACGGDDDGDSSSADTSAGTTSTSTGTIFQTTSGYVGTAHLAGTAFFEGAPWAGAAIRFCDMDKCRSQDADDSGVFDFPETYADWNSLEVPGLHTQTDNDPKYVTAFVPLVFADNESRTVDLHVRELESFTSFGAGSTEIMAGSGLYLTVGATDLETPALVDPATGVGGLRLDPAEWVPTDEIEGDVVHQWFTYPWNYTAPNGLAVRVDGNALGMTGASYHMYVGSYDAFRWLDVGELTDADGDGWYDCAGTLPLLSTVIIVEMPPATSTGTTGSMTTTSSTTTSST